MKQSIKAGLLPCIVCIVAGLVLFGCNTPPGPETEDVIPEDITIQGEDLGRTDWRVDNDSGGWVADLSGVLDLKYYSTVVIEARLYDLEENLIAAADCVDSMAQFKLLSAGASSANWDTDSILEGYNLKTGTNSKGVGSSDTGIPLALAVQKTTGGDDPQGERVGKIEVISVKFIARTDLPSFSVIFGGSCVSVEGNKITFTDAENDDGAAYYGFPASVLPVNGKTITVAYRLEPGYNPDLEHQLIIQAAAGDSDVNYENDYQKYIDLDKEEGPDEGSFEINGTQLAEAGANKDFTTIGFRIVNNGGEWRDTDDINHVREKTYSFTVNSITVN
jgi:hypothetical protein